MVIASEMSQYPVLQETEAQAAQLLGQYGVVDADAGLYRIPIDQAIQLQLNQAAQAAPGTYSSQVKLVP